jgi:hypothetical protein
MMWLAVATIVVATAMGYIWLNASVNSYDHRYEKCMKVKQDKLYQQGQYFPDDAYNQAMRECENEAGLPPPTEHPHPMNETP